MPEKSFSYVWVINASVMFAVWLMSFLPDVFRPVLAMALGIVVITTAGVVWILMDICCFTWKYLRKKRKA